METPEPFDGSVASPPIIESGINTITMDDGYENCDYDPVDGIVKWFRDELGQIWVKFNADEKSNLVWPAAQVRCVEFDKPAHLQAV